MAPWWKCPFTLFLCLPAWVGPTHTSEGADVPHHQAQAAVVEMCSRRCQSRTRMSPYSWLPTLPEIQPSPQSGKVTCILSAGQHVGRDDPDALLRGRERCFYPRRHPACDRGSAIARPGAGRQTSWEGQGRRISGSAAVWFAREYSALLLRVEGSHRHPASWRYGRAPEFTGTLGRVPRCPQAAAG